MPNGTGHLRNIVLRKTARVRAKKTARVLTKNTAGWDDKKKEAVPEGAKTLWARYLPLHSVVQSVEAEN